MCTQQVGKGVFVGGGGSQGGREGGYVSVDNHVNQVEVHHIRKEEQEKPKT